MIGSEGNQWPAADNGVLMIIVFISINLTYSQRDLTSKVTLLFYLISILYEKFYVWDNQWTIFYLMSSKLSLY